MSIARKTVGDPIEYRGHSIEARHMGPDLLCYVDGNEVGHFYRSVEAAHNAGKRYVDQIEKEKDAEIQNG
jgi:hypothetical protein